MKEFIEFMIDYEMQSTFRRCEKQFKVISTVVRPVNCLNHQDNCLMDNYIR